MDILKPSFGVDDLDLWKPMTSEEFETNDDLLMLFFDGTPGGLWMEQLKHSCPSDYIVLDGKDGCGDLFLETVRNSGISGMGVPDDLFETDMVPMEDVLFRFDETDMWFRVCTKYPTKYMVIDLKKVTYVFELETLGSMAARHPEIDFTQEEQDALITKEHTVMLNMFVRVLSNEPMTSGYLSAINRATGNQENYIVFDHMLKMWYGCMILLLNPSTQEILMERKGKEKLRQQCLTPKKTGKRKAVYVKKHRIDTDIWEEVAKRNGIERRTLSWYVVGHWRTYKKTGKKTFIKPYWKGPLRELERNFDTTRKREFRGTL